MKFESWFTGIVLPALWDRFNISLNVDGEPYLRLKFFASIAYHDMWISSVGFLELCTDKDGNWRGVDDIVGDLA